jgi:hypothetical protein
MGNFGLSPKWPSSPKKKKEKQKKGAKFANITNYESSLKKKEKGVLPYYWLPNRTYHKSLVFYKLFFSTKFGQFGTIYFP